MSEPTPEQIEAAADAMEQHYDKWSGPDEEPPTYADLAEVAIVAAAAAALAAPVWVDEAKLAEVLARHRATTWRPGAPTECLCNWRSSLRDPSHQVHVARELAAWLRGGGR